MSKAKQAAKAVDKRIERAFYASCNGIQIPVLKMGAVFAHGRTVIAQGADDETLAREVRAFVETIRVPS